MSEQQLNANEIDHLLDVFRTGGREAQVEVESLDLNRPSPIPKSTLEALQIRHEQAALEVSRVFRQALGGNASVTVEGIEQDRFGGFRETLSDPCCVIVWEMAPLRQPAYLIVDFKFAYAAIDRMLGGQGDPSGNARELTTTELAVFNEIQEPLMQIMSGAWSRWARLTPRQLHTTSVPRFLREVNQDDAVIVARLKTHGLVGETVIAVVMPIAGLEGQLLSARHAEPEEPPPEALRQSLVQHMHQVEVAVQVVLGSADIPVRQLTLLEVGDVVVLDRRLHDPVELQVEGSTKFIGHLHQRGGAVVFRVNDGQGSGSQALVRQGGGNP